MTERDDLEQPPTTVPRPRPPSKSVRSKLQRDQRAKLDSDFAHNHPSGDPKPSRDDIEMTREIKAASETLGIAIHDHLVIGRMGHASFRRLGLLT